jgi:hypothetical protein
MSAPLEPCPTCARHVRTTETACPFCGAALGVAFRARAPRVAPRARLGRTAVFAFGAALAVSACSDGDDPPPPPGDMGGSGDAGGDDLGPPPLDMGDVDMGGIAPLYGEPPPPDDGGTPAIDGGGRDAGVDMGGIAPLYGLPPPEDASTPPADAGQPDAGDAGGIAPLYGLPPEPG